MRVNVKDDKNKIIGWLSTNNGVTQALHNTKGYCGRYVHASDITFDKNGKIFCYGDGAQSLIRFVHRGLL